MDGERRKLGGGLVWGRGVRRTSVKGSASMCAESRGCWLKDVFPSAEPHLEGRGGLGGGAGQFSLSLPVFMCLSRLMIHSFAAASCYECPS